MTSKQRGDTIVEVLISTVVIAIVLSGAYALTNRATRINQTAIERTTASKLMQEQIELIRGAQTKGANSETWQAIKDQSSQTPNYSSCTPSGPNGFYIDVNAIGGGFDFDNAGVVVPYDDYIANPLVDSNPTDFYRVWVEKVQPVAAGYADFHVRACWEGIGGEAEQKAAIVLRLSL